MRRLAFAAILVLLAGCNSDYQAPIRQPAAVTAATAAVAGNLATLEVSGYHGACDTVLPAVQKRAGNTVTVTIQSESTPGACILLATGWSQQIVLDGSFGPGNYVVHVNDFTTGFTVQ